MENLNLRKMSDPISSEEKYRGARRAADTAQHNANGAQKRADMMKKKADDMQKELIDG